MARYPVTYLLIILFRKMTDIKDVYFLVPRLDDSGPVRGAFALVKGLNRHKYLAKIICLSDENKIQDENTIFLKSRFFFTQFLSLKKIAKKNKNCLFVSVSFKTDLLLVFLLNTITIQYIRGNLYKNYYYTYGVSGYFLAFLQYSLGIFFDKTIALNKIIAEHVRLFTNEVVVINNFVDEAYLTMIKLQYQQRNSDSVTTFVFIGSLNLRKKPDIILDACIKLSVDKLPFHLAIIGDGELQPQLEKTIEENDLGDYVTLYGHLSEPFSVLNNCDVFILPSMSEGTSRAMLETQFLGLPTIARNIDCNSDVVLPENLGFLFTKDEELYPIMKYFLKRNIKRQNRSLLNKKYTESWNINKIKLLFDNL